MVQSVLGRLILGYRPLWGRARKLAGIQRIQKAKAILMDGQGLNEAEAYESIRRQAMSKRLSMDDMAAAIIHANELLQYRPKGD